MSLNLLLPFPCTAPVSRSRFSLFRNLPKTMAVLTAGLLINMGSSAQLLVPSGAEASFYGTVSLSTPGSQTWQTNRSATPGYFSLVGTAQFTNAANNSQNLVDGYVKHYSTAAGQAVAMPVGSGTKLRTLSTSGTLPAGMAVASAWIPGDPSGNLDPTNTGAAGGAHSVLSLGPGLVGVSTVGQWDWQDFNDNAGGATVTVSIPDVTGFALAPNMRLAGWDGTEWINLSGTSGASGVAEGSTLSGTIPNGTGISALAIAATSVSLPLTLVSFDASSANCMATLSWRTAQESNTSHFVVEQSISGGAYMAIGTVPAKGNANAASYDFNATQNADYALYRLKMVDKDGSFTYSSIIGLRQNCESATNALKVYPNPLPAAAMAILTVEYTGDYKGQAMLMVYSATGQLVHSQAVSLRSGKNIVPVALPANTWAGTYLLRLASANGQLLGTPKAFIKQ